MAEAHPLSTAETIKERVKTLTTLYAACTHPLTVALETFSVVLVPRKEDVPQWREKGVLSFLPQEFAWLVAGQELGAETIDLSVILHAKAVLPARAELGGFVLLPEHWGEPFFQHNGQPTILICGHPQPPTTKAPACVLSPQDVLALYEAPAGTCDLLLRVRRALAGAPLVRVLTDESHRGDVVVRWRDLSILCCTHDGHPTAMGEAAQNGSPVIVTASVLEHLTALHEPETEAALSVLRVFPGATLFPA